MLRLTHSQCSSLIEDLKQYDFSGFGGEASASSSITIDRRTGVSTTVTLASMLDSAMEEMFSQYIEGGRYLELEGKWLAIAYKDLAAKYQKFHVSPVITSILREEKLIEVSWIIKGIANQSEARKPTRSCGRQTLHNGRSDRRSSRTFCHHVRDISCSCMATSIRRQCIHRSDGSERSDRFENSHAFTIGCCHA
jgi:predicted lipid carrier protein YhbT